MRKLKLVRQPKDSNLCGQACVATILGITLDESIELFGTRGRTTWKKVIGVLRSRGVKCDNELTIVNGSGVPVRCIVKIWWGTKENATHWSIRDGDRLLDPHNGEFKWGHIPPRTKENINAKTSRITSYGEIKW